MRRIALFVLFALAVPSFAATAEKVDKNIVYGMYSGLALLMDVHQPVRPNGLGLIIVRGSGWNSPQAYDSPQLKDLDPGATLASVIPPLLNAGYTLFVINHRNGPRFRYPAQVEDGQRAVRFIRHNAQSYGINPDRIGALGHSSGAYLALMLGVLDGKGDPDDTDAMNRESARVQCVVALSPATDLEHFNSGEGVPFVASFMGQIQQEFPVDPIATKAYRSASPITYISASSAPTLLAQGDADTVVPIRQSESMFEAARKAGTDVKMIRLPGGGHSFPLETSKHPEWPDFLDASVHWLDGHLKPPVTAAK